MTGTGRYEDGAYLDAAGRRWEREDEHLEPDDVRRLLDAGTEALVERCGAGPAAVDSRTLEHEVLPEVLGRRAAARKIRRRTVPTVFVAERWSDGDGHLLVFVEGPPAPRVLPGG